MFTGIIQELGKIKRITKTDSVLQIIISCKELQKNLVNGASISCNGICLTVSRFDDSSVHFEAMIETISKTTVSEWNIGTSINLERAVGLNDKLDGHLVQGHIDTVTSLSKISRQQRTVFLMFQLPAEFAHLLVEKGSIAINGVSLTISSLNETSFTVALVDFTMKHTNLGTLQPGSKVNLEFDIIGKYITRYTQLQNRRLSKDSLRENGY